MDRSSAHIESELLDLSMVDVSTLRAVDSSGLAAAIDRVRTRLADSEGSISGYNGSFATPPASGRPDDEASVV
jgi:FXSXX-COOH protein